MNVQDPYIKLKPRPPTPEEELCACSMPSGVLLQPHLTDNPLVCRACSGEVPPERIPLLPEFADDLGQWAALQGAMETLWLESGSYEDFARGELENMGSPLNQRGYELAQNLSTQVPCDYFLFQDEGVEGYVRPGACPRCEATLSADGKWQRCPACKIVV
jgi:hypothetical protein